MSDLPRPGTVGAAPRAATSAAALALVCVCSVLSCLQHQPAFLLPANDGSQRTSGAPQHATAVPAEAAAAARTAPSLFGTGFSTVGLAAAAVMLAVRRSREEARNSSKVAMQAHPTRTARRWKTNVKGQKPMIHRKVARDVIKDSFENWISQKKVKERDFFEKIVRTQLHGKHQFQFTSEHFTDSMPLNASLKMTKRQMGVNWEHRHDDPFYVRKYLEPSKFKKLAIASWEMPDSYTRAVTLKELVEAGVQYGHKSNKWNPAMLKYLYADNDGTHIFDLVQTAAGLNRACYYCMEAAAMGANFIFIGTKAQARPIIKKYAEDLGVHYADEKFVGGIISNFSVIRKSIGLLKALQEQKDQGAWNNLGSGLKMSQENKLRRLARKYHGIMDMDSIPDICVFVDEVKERNPIAEMTRIGIPCIGMIDSDNEPQYIDLPIPGNCSGSRSIDLCIGKLAEAIKKGKMINSTTEEGDRQVVPKEWDPWIFSRDRYRKIRRRSKRQGWMKAIYKNYENWKSCHPFGAIPTVAPFHDFKWNDAWDG